MAELDRATSSGDSALSTGGRRLREFAESARQAAIRLKLAQESADELFDRLGREGRSPQGPRGFLSRAEFVELERQRRAELALIQQQAAGVNALRYTYERLREVSRSILGEDPSAKFDRLRSIGQDPRNERGFMSRAEFIERENIAREENNLVNQLRRSYEALKDTLREKVETPSDLFDRLGREGQAPRAGGRFQSRADFIAQEERERQLQRESTLVGQLGVQYRKLREGFTKDALQESRAWGEITKGIELARAAARDDELSTPEFITIKGRQRLAEEEAERKKATADARAQFNELREEQERLDQEQRASLHQAQLLGAQMRDEQILEEKKKFAEFKRARRADFEDEVRQDKYILAHKSEYADALIDDAEKRIRDEIEAREQLIAEEEVEVSRRINAIKAAHKAAEEDITGTVKAEIDKRRRDQTEQHRKDLAEIAIQGREKRNQIALETAEERRNLPQAIVDRDRQRREALRSPDLTPLARSTAIAAAGIGDLVRGFRGARRGLQEFTGAALTAQRGLARVGAAFGEASRNIGSIVNIRWFLIISLLSTLLSVAIQLGAALVALGASAITAGAALGGALAAGAAQALPVVGLLAAAMNKLEAAMKVVELRQRARDTAGEDEKARAQAAASATEQLINARQNLRNATEAVVEAEEGIADAHERVAEAAREQRQAIAGLAQARRDAARAIVDANLDEREAALSLEEAELGVLDAKQRLADFMRDQQRGVADLEQAQAEVREAQERLRIARSEGDQAEIISATQNLSFANQNVSAIKDRAAQARDSQRELELAIERSELNAEQARVRNERAAEEAARRRRQGVQGSPELEAARERVRRANEAEEDAADGVTAAERRKRDAVERVAAANRNLAASTAAATAASDKQSAAARNAEREYNKLSAGQKAIVDSLERLKATWRSPAITNIIDPMLLAISRGMNAINRLLQDPEILGAFKGLSETIAAIGDSFTRWIISPEAKDFLLLFIREARINLPTIAEAAGDFAIALLNIAKSARFVFRDLVELIAHWGQGLRNVTSDTERLDKFFDRAGEHLGQWIELVAAVGEFIVVLTGASADAGLKMLESITAQFQDWSDWIRKHPRETAKFFEDMRESLSRIIPMLFNFFGKLVEVLTSPEFAQFTEFVLTIMLPAIVDLVGLLGELAKILNTLTEIPFIGPLIELGLKILLITGLFFKLFPIAKLVLGLFNTRRFLIFAALLILVEHWDKVTAALKRVKKWFEDLPGAIKPIIALIGTAAAAGTLIFALSVLSGRFGAAATGSGRLATQLGRLASTLITGGGGGSIARLIGRAGLAAAVGVLAYEATQAILKITGLDKKLEEFGRKAADTVGGSKTGRRVAGFFGFDFGSEEGYTLDDLNKRYGEKRLSNALAHYQFLRQNRKMAHREALIETAKEFRMSATDLSKYLPDTIENRKYALGGPIGEGGFRRMRDDDRQGIKASGHGEEVPIIAHVGEWVLNKRQQAKAAAMLGTSTGGLASALFGSQNNTGSFDLGGLIGRVLGTNTGSKRGKALEGYEDYIREVLATYREFRRSYPHKETMFALKSQYPQIPRDALDAMIPLSYRARAFADGGIVGRALEFSRSAPARAMKRAGVMKVLDIIGRGGRAAEFAIAEYFGVNDVKRFKDDPKDWTNSLSLLLATAGVIPIGAAVRATGRGAREIGRLARQYGELEEARTLLRKLPTKRWQDPPGLLTRIDSRTGAEVGIAPGRTRLGLSTSFVGDAAEHAVARMGGRILNVDNRNGSFDAQFGRHIMEVKAMTRFRSELKTSISRDRVQNKLEAARKAGKVPATGIFVVDHETGMGHLYWREGIGSWRLSKEGWNFGGSVPIKLPPIVNRITARPRGTREYPRRADDRTNDFMRAGAEGVRRTRKGIEGGKVFYHGTRAVFDKFNNRFTKAQAHGLYGPGHYFTDDPAIATSYATGDFVTSLRREFGGITKTFENSRQLRRYREQHPEHLLRHTELKRGNPDSAIPELRERRIVAHFMDVAKERPNVKAARLDLKKVLNIHGPLNASLARAVEKELIELGPRLPKSFHTKREGWPASRYQEALNKVRKWKRDPDGYTNEHLYQDLGDPLYGIGKDRANALLRRIGYDAIRYDGGARMGGQYHNAYVVFNSKSIMPGFSAGGPVKGGAEGKAIPIMAHVGEWVLNKGQQLKLAQRLKTKTDELKMWLFGTEGKRPNGEGDQKPVGAKGKTKPKGPALTGPGFKLHPETDENGWDIWFIELDNGKWGQVSAEHAARIMSSRGAWIPKYVQRAGHASGINSVISGGGGFMQAFSGGGEVRYQGAGMQSFAAGGTVLRPASDSIVRRGNTVNQEFQIHTASPKVDVDYIMRVGAMHAEGAY